MCMHVSTAPQPHFKGVRLCSTCTSGSAPTILLIPGLTVPVYLSVHVRPCVLMLVWTMLRSYEATNIWVKQLSYMSCTLYVHKLTHIPNFNSSTVLSKQARETHTHWSDESPAKMSCGRTDNWLLLTSNLLHRGETESQTTSCRVNTQKIKQKKLCIHIRTVRMFSRMIIWGARANQRHTRHHRRSQECVSDLCMCVRACADHCRECSQKWTDKKHIRSYTLVKHKYDYVFTERKGKR
jgi:hypothetical protein